MRGELAIVPLRGTRIGEVAFVHGPSRTLVLTDAVFNYGGADLSWLARVFMRVNRAYDRFGPSRIFTSFVVSDREAFSASIGALLEHDFDRVIMSHGRMLATGGKAAIRDAFST